MSSVSDPTSSYTFRIDLTRDIALGESNTTAIPKLANAIFDLAEFKFQSGIAFDLDVTAPRVAVVTCPDLHSATMFKLRYSDVFIRDGAE